MKSMFIILTALMYASVAAADPLEGMWRTAKDDNGNSGLIEVAPCGDALCGVLVKAFDQTEAETDSDNVGTKIIWDTRPNGDGTYAGMIYSPDRDKEYKSSLELKGSTLEVSGCVMFVCRSGGSWTREN